MGVFSKSEIAKTGMGKLADSVSKYLSDHSINNELNDYTLEYDNGKPIIKVIGESVGLKFKDKIDIPEYIQFHTKQINFQFENIKDRVNLSDLKINKNNCLSSLYLEGIKDMVKIHVDYLPEKFDALLVRNVLFFNVIKDVDFPVYRYSRAFLYHNKQGEFKSSLIREIFSENGYIHDKGDIFANLNHKFYPVG